MIDLDQLVLAPKLAVWSEANIGKPTPVYTPNGGGAATPIDGIVRIPSLTAFGVGASDAPGLTTRKPELDVRASQVPPGITIAQGDTFVVRGVTYAVADVRPDGDGLLTLMLVEGPVSA